jgi:hypothetical protein
LRSCKKSAYGAEEIAPPGAAAPRTGLRGALPMALAFLAAIALLSPSRALAAIGLPQIGTTVSDAIMLGDRQVPLPIGEWHVVATGFGTVAGRSPGPYGAILGVTLARLRGDIYLAVHRYDTRVDGLCIFAKHVLVVPTASDMSNWAAARRWLAARQIALSGTWLMAGFRVRDRTQMLDIRYYFPSPDDAGDPLPTNWASSAWAPRRVAKGPRGAAGSTRSWPGRAQ